MKHNKEGQDRDKTGNMFGYECIDNEYGLNNLGMDCIRRLSGALLCAAAFPSSTQTKAPGSFSFPLLNKLILKHGTNNKARMIAGVLLCAS